MEQLKNYTWAILWAIFIAWLSLTTGSNLPDVDFFAPDKLGHIFVYGVLVFLILQGVQKTQISFHNKIILWAIIASSVYGFLLECAQFYITVDRYFENLDILANIIGSIGGGLLFYFLFIRNSKVI